MNANSEHTRAIVLMNLGSPDDTSRGSVKKYLDEFLMDEKVIDKPYLFRYLLVKGIITPLRAGKSAEAYETIWTKDGSPLVHTTIQVAKKLAAQISEPVEVVMRYGSLTPEKAFNNLLARHPQIKDVVAVPMYPHYAMSSFETAAKHIQDAYNKVQYPFSLQVVKPYYNNPLYIAALAASMQPYTSQPFDHILFSYHGIPARHLRKTDNVGHCLEQPDCCNIASAAHQYCYRHQCFTTTRLVTEALQIPTNKYSISFQSRLGKGWLQPFTDVRLKEMPAEGIKNLLVICPAFVSDCLETLEEIEIRGKEIFTEAGGASFKMIPCLNESKEWIDCLQQLIRKEHFFTAEEKHVQLR